MKVEPFTKLSAVISRTSEGLDNTSNKSVISCFGDSLFIGVTSEDILTYMDKHKGEIDESWQYQEGTNPINLSCANNSGRFTIENAGVGVHNISLLFCNGKLKDEDLHYTTKGKVEFMALDDIDWNLRCKYDGDTMRIKVRGTKEGYRYNLLDANKTEMAYQILGAGEQKLVVKKTDEDECYGLDTVRFESFKKIEKRNLFVEGLTILGQENGYKSLDTITLCAKTGYYLNAGTTSENDSQIYNYFFSTTMNPTIVPSSEWANYSKDSVQVPYQVEETVLGSDGQDSIVYVDKVKYQYSSPLLVDQYGKIYTLYRRTLANETCINGAIDTFYVKTFESLSLTTTIMNPDKSISKIDNVTFKVDGKDALGRERNNTLAVNPFIFGPYCTDTTVTIQVIGKPTGGTGDLQYAFVDASDANSAEDWHDFEGTNAESKVTLPTRNYYALST